MPKTFNLEVKDHIAHLQLSRPDKRNAMSREFWQELPVAIKEIDEAGEARVLVLSSTGPHFTAGLDLQMFSDGDVQAGEQKNDPNARKQQPVKFMENLTRLQGAFNALENARIPVLAAIQGGCIGGGVDMITACDMRYMTKDAFLTVFEIKVGMTADVGTFPRIVKLLPEGIVRELAYTGRQMPAEEALQLGFVNKVYDTQEAMLEGVMAIAKEIASHPPLAVYGCKRAIQFSRDHNTQDGLDWIGMWNASMLHNDEVMESITARQEKRAGKFATLPRKVS